MAASVGALIISAVTADATIAATTIIGSLTVGEVVGAVAIAALEVGLSAALAPGAPITAVGQENLKQPVAPRRRYYGRNKVGGTFVFWRVQNGFFYLFLDLVDDQIQEFEAIWLNDDQVTFTGNFVDTPTQYTFSGVKRLQVYTQLGTPDQVALAKMVADWPGVWTTDHRLQGVATMLLICQTVAAQNFTAVYPDGEPTGTAIIKAALVWDPRAGADPSVKTYSDNFALCVLDYLLHPDGMALPFALFTAAGLDDWKARADECDVQVALLAGGTEARFRLWMGYDLSEQRKTVLQRMLDAAGARVIQRYDGSPILQLPDYVEPSDGAILDDSVISVFQELRPGNDAGERYNEIRATVVLEQTGWVQDEALPWRNEVAIAAEGLQTKTLDLTGCPSHRQARVRMKLEAWRSNPKWIGTAITNAAGMNALGAPLLRLQKPVYSFDEVVETTGFPVAPDTYSCAIAFRSMPSAAFAWNVDEEGVGPSIESTGDTPTVDVPTTVVATVSFNGYSTGVDAPQIVVTCDDPGRDDYIFYGETRVHDGAIPDDDAVWSAMITAVGAFRCVSPPLNPGDYDARVRFQSASGQISDWVYVRSISA